jgi:tetratricopeptide (TPR) repeat protein
VGIFDGLQRWQRRRKAKALLDSGDVEGARAVIANDSALRHELAEGLLDSGRLELSQALLGHEVSTLDALLKATPADPELDRLLTEASSRTLPAEARVLQLSRTLLERGEQEPALVLLERAALSSRQWPLLRAGIEASCEAKSWERAWHLVEAAFGSSKQLRGTPEHEFLLRSHQLVLTQLEGAEAVTVDLMMRGELDPFSGHNHLLLAKALMRDSPLLASRLTLVSAPQELREGEARLQSDRKNAGALALVGSAKLRLGELEEAAGVFERGRDVAPRHFALVAGLGAARSLAEDRAIARVRSLPDLSPLAGLNAVLPDHEQLTMLELRVAQASMRPLAKWLPALSAAGSRLRVLPLDVRVTDLPDFEGLKGQVEARYRRAWNGVGGLAGDGLTCVRVEELFDLTDVRWTFAHEFAHLVHQVLPEPLQQQLHSAWQAAKRAEFAFDQYQLSNEYEFFAVTYTRWLCRKYGLPATLEADTEGHLERAFQGIDAVAN